MTRRLLDNSIPVYLEPASAETAKNPIARLNSVQSLADLMCQHRRIISTIGTLVACSREGFSREAIQRQKLQIAVLPLPKDVVDRTAVALDSVSSDYSARFCDPNVSAKEKAGLKQLFVAAICEALVYEALLSNGRQDAAITQDAHVYIGPDSRRSSRNIDFVWADPPGRQVEIYEARTSPFILVQKFLTKDAPGNEVEWRKEKLAVMLSLHDALVANGWSSLLACVCLDSAQSDKRVSYPPELTIYYREQLAMGKFPPALRVSA